MTGRATWTPTDVVDVSGPPALLRNYLDHLPFADATARFAVLQHMPDGLAERVLADMTRVAAPDAHLLLCDETDSALDPRMIELSYPRDDVGTFMFFRGR